MRRTWRGAARPAAPGPATDPEARAVHEEDDGAAADGSTGWTPDAPRTELPTRRQLRLQQVDGRAVAPETDQPARDLKEPLPGGRRDRRLQYTASMAALQGTGTVPARMPPAGPSTTGHHGPDGGMTVEEALAERNALASATREHVDEVMAQGSDDPFAVDPVLLERQRVLAQRAAALNARARQAQEQADRPVLALPAPQDPTVPSNLSFLAPLQVLHVAGSNQVVLQASTSLIPVVIPGAALPGAIAPASGPVGARSAFGLDPLDAMTAGQRRLRRMRYLQYSVFGVGAAALATGIMMIVSSLNG
ncbi:hypothetical protein AC792_00135 [Arthrobacter sp. RIT-PI-e]|uniref:hypothetical protein n=1 Tax=Arthrobacter sp. RIT-PI-e TaxID=1681197 RepID=UPI000675E018|nr:hypothetical protein [Arthrobacter sp. RIT-PI-e]KNC20523.1 hypothetical protein AC792_00135 [Arthrobacter sp. RIT-PI-e]